MPPKKAATNGSAGAANGGGGKFTWEGPNDYKLLLLTQGRYVKPEEYEQLCKAFPGTSNSPTVTPRTHANTPPPRRIRTGSIRNRISALRVKQRDLYQDLGWTLPDGGAGYSAKKKNAGKHGLDFEGGASEPETPTKKPRVRKAAKEVKKKEGSDGESGAGSGEEKGVNVEVEVIDEDDEGEAV